MQKTILLLLLLLFIPTVLSINIEVEQKEAREVLINGLENPAKFTLEITNLNQSDNFEFINLLGFKMLPEEPIPIKKGETKEVELVIFPRSEFNVHGHYIFTYLIKGRDAQLSDHDLTIKIIDLEEAFQIGVEEFDTQSNEISIFIKNKENFEFDNLDVEFTSAFFKTKKEFSLGAKDKKTFKLKLNKEDFKKLTAGFYTMKSTIKAQNQEAIIEGIINFEENEDLKTSSKDYGLFINTRIITKENTGNTLQEIEIDLEKNILSRLFTSLNPEPDRTQRDDLIIKYFWTREITPGETFEVKVKTNWILPIIILILIITILLLIKHYNSKDVILKKSVNFVHTKNGDFALKVNLFIKARKYVEKINIIDRLPPLVKLYHKFGGGNPSKINQEKRRIDWDFQKLEPGEIRRLSYVIHSKVGVLGKFALPTATAIFEREGELSESQSNHVYFMAEQTKSKSGNDENSFD